MLNKQQLLWNRRGAYSTGLGKPQQMQSPAPPLDIVSQGRNELAGQLYSPSELCSAAFGSYQLHSKWVCGFPQGAAL